MRTIHEQIGVTWNTRKSFREEILILTLDTLRLKQINVVVDRLVKEHGYCTVRANELPKYVGKLLSR